MIVEDDLTILSNLSQLLQLSGLDVMEAHDGQEALRLLLECRVHDAALPRMIVSDLMMPNMDGFDLLRAIRGDTHFKNLPFVLLSARSDASDLQQAFALGANDYLIKPFEVEQLMDVIRHHLSHPSGRKSDPLTGKNCTVDIDFFLE